MLLFSNIFDSLSNMDYDPELFGKALPCLIAIGCALPPDYSLSKNTDEDYYGRQSGAPDQPQYDPQPIETATVNLTHDYTQLVEKFSEHYHDAWASRRLESGWTYGEVRSDTDRKHPRLKPCNMLSEYVCLYGTLLAHIVECKIRFCQYSVHAFHCVERQKLQIINLCFTSTHCIFVLISIAGT